MVKNLSELSQTLRSNDARGWTKSTELGGLSHQNPSEIGQVADKTFGEFLKDSISKVNSLQVEANKAMEKLASGESKNIHETLLAVEQAEMAFKTMNQVRSKVIDAYKEIMRMQI